MTTMKALGRDGVGSPDLLRIKDVPKPAPREDEVLVRVRAASLNDWDRIILEPRERPRFGCDMAGRVEAVGSKVTRFRPGDDVYCDMSRYGPRSFGAFAEYACPRERALALKPPRMTYEQAAAIPQAGMLALQCVTAAGPLKDGQRILINGAGGGVGTIGIQLAKLHDVEVTGVDKASKFDMMRSAGFDHLVDYTKEDFTEAGRQYDLIVDTRTTRAPRAYVRALTPAGTYATCGGAKMAPLFRILLSSPWIKLTTGRTVTLVMVRPNRDLAYFNQLFEAGKFAPVIDGPYKFEDAASAFRRLVAGDHLGKIVMTLD